MNLESSISGFFSNLVSATLIFVIGFILGRILGRILYLLLLEYDAKKLLKSVGGVTAAFIVGSVLSYTIYFITLIIALNQFGLTNLALVSFSVIVVLIMLVAAILGVNSFFKNILLFFTQKESYKKNDIVSFSNIKAKLVLRTPVNIKVKTKKGDIFIIPNSAFDELKLKKLNLKKL